MTPTPAQTGGGGPAAGHPRRPDRSLTVGDLTAHPSITIAPDEPAEHAVRLMHNCRVKLLLVVDASGHPVGTVGPADLLAADGHPHSSYPEPQGRDDHDADRGGAITAMVHHKELEKADGVTAGDLMTRNVVTVKPDDTVEQAARLMYHLQVNPPRRGGRERESRWDEPPWSRISGPGH